MNAIFAFLVWLWSLLTYLPRRFLAAFARQRETIFRPVHVEDLPDALSPGSVYLAGEGENLWAAAMLCPCGCGEVIELNLLPQVRPRWAVDEHVDGKLTLTPSVWRQKGCRSHFILRDGRIIWC
jgi:hypothetical protein